MIFKITTGVTFGAFDLLHPGHLVFLNECRKQCDRLTIGLHVDPHLERPEKNKPVQSVMERYIQIKYTRIADEIIPYETEDDLLNLIQSYRFNKRFLDHDYTDKVISGFSSCETLGTEIIYIDRYHGWSSSELRIRINRTK